MLSFKEFVVEGDVVDFKPGEGKKYLFAPPGKLVDMKKTKDSMVGRVMLIFKNNVDLKNTGRQIMGVWNNPPTPRREGKPRNRTFKILGLHVTNTEIERLSQRYREVYGDRFVSVKNGIANSSHPYIRRTESPEPKVIITFTS